MARSGSGAGVSVSLEGTGQATSQSASPFSSPTLSPKVIYREIATSDKVIAAAAKYGDPVELLEGFVT